MEAGLPLSSNPGSGILYSAMADTRRTVFVGLSGGVDSAVSAALLAEAGHRVTGVFVRVALSGYPCSAGEDRREAIRVAAHLGIPFRDIDLSGEYRTQVFEASMSAYRRGETPNPDALCNREIKFGLLYDYAMAAGADALATGHYARIQDGTLMTGADPEKDQSYFLWAVAGERLARVLFPVGGLRKGQVRAAAKKRGLPNALRKDSQGICFLGGLSMDQALVRELEPVPGEVLDAGGARVGTHQGAVLYTMGQRHGFNVHATRAQEEPLYVVGKDMGRNTITVAPQGGTPERARAPHKERTLRLRETNWIGGFDDGAYGARFRYRQPLLPASISRAGDGAAVRIPDPGPIPLGQSLVLYDGERCLGGGIIAAAS